MRVLVIGGSGFISGEIARQSIEAGHDVTLFHRGETPSSLEVRSIHGDAGELSRSADALRALEPEVVVHCVCSSEHRADELVRTFTGTGAHLVALGSQDCYDAFQQILRDRDAYDLPLDERSATTPIRYYWRNIHDHGDPDYDKNLMTDRLLRAHARGDVSATVFRLPMVYGPRDRQFAFRHGAVLRRIVDRRTRLVSGIAAQARIFTFGYVENIAAAIVHAFGRADVRGRIYNLGESSVRTARRWADLYAAAANFVFEHVALPDELIERDPSHRTKPPAHLIVDSSRFRADTGFVDPVSLTDGIARTLVWATAHPDALGPSPDYAAEDRLVSAYAAAMDRLRDR